ncbi:IclR family transcriptional regulator [Novosphingobium terrae]|uniref:IclR family transcriptional regulator n=1 Tax=Novosphingobium terrae TaxID=2726189 RepID=UPI0019804B66|nr:IclR family transcriptional regulator [Novosphingobium terrae]
MTASNMVYSAPALEKGLDIIELLSTEPDGLTANEIARRLKRSINEVFRMIMVMEQRRWLSQTADSRYRVTYEVVKFALRATPAQGLIDAAAPVMHDLARATYQSSHLVVLSQQQGFVLHRQENVGPVGFGMRLGAPIDLITSCSGNVLLAFSAPEIVASLLKDLPRPKSLTLKALQSQLAKIREDGCASRPSLRTEGVHDISYPVFGFDGTLAAVLTMPYLRLIDGSQQFDFEETGAALAQAATKISRTMGWAG